MRGTEVYAHGYTNRSSTFHFVYIIFFSNFLLNRSHNSTQELIEYQKCTLLLIYCSFLICCPIISLSYSQLIVIYYLEKLIYFMNIEACNVALIITFISLPLLNIPIYIYHRLLLEPFTHLSTPTIRVYIPTSPLFSYSSSSLYSLSSVFTCAVNSATK